MANLMSGGGERGRQIAVDHARSMHTRGRLTTQELEHVHKLADREKLSELDPEEYSGMRESGEFSRIQKATRLDDNEASKAETSLAHVLSDFVLQGWQSGAIHEKDAVQMLSQLIDLPEGKSPGDQLVAHALEAAEPDYRPAPKAGREIGADDGELSDATVAEFRKRYPNGRGSPSVASEE